MIRFSELMNMVLLTGAAVVLLWLVCRNNRAILWLDVRLLMGCMLLMALRLFILVESPVSSSVAVLRVYPELCRRLREPRFHWLGGEANLMLLLKALWALGAAASGAYRAGMYCRTRRQIRRYRWVRRPEYAEAVRKVNRELGRKVKFRLVSSREVPTPCVFGVTRPYIAVPEMEFTREELYFILKHEMLHYYRGDMLVRVLCEALKAVYWWDVFAYMLARLVYEMQEVNVDFKVIEGLPAEEQLRYPDCLVKVSRKREVRRREDLWAIGFRKESPSEANKRISLMLGNQDMGGRKTTASLLLSAGLLCMVVLCPNMLTFEPYGIPDEHVEGSVGVTGGGICCLDNKDGTYDIYIDGQYYMTVMEIFDERVPVYDSLEEVTGND